MCRKHGHSKPGCPRLCMEPGNQTKADGRSDNRRLRVLANITTWSEASVPLASGHRSKLWRDDEEFLN